MSNFGGSRFGPGLYAHSNQRANFLSYELSNLVSNFISNYGPHYSTHNSANNRAHNSTDHDPLYANAHCNTNTQS